MDEFFGSVRRSSFREDALSVVFGGVKENRLRSKLRFFKVKQSIRSKEGWSAPRDLARITGRRSSLQALGGFVRGQGETSGSRGGRARLGGSLLAAGQRVESELGTAKLQTGWSSRRWPQKSRGSGAGDVRRARMS